MYNQYTKIKQPGIDLMLNIKIYAVYSVKLFALSIGF
jgi:hypothetical protein